MIGGLGIVIVDEASSRPASMGLVSWLSDGIFLHWSAEREATTAFGELRSGS